jgi:hypothetical protein
LILVEIAHKNNFRMSCEILKCLCQPIGFHLNLRRSENPVKIRNCISTDWSLSIGSPFGNHNFGWAQCRRHCLKCCKDGIKCGIWNLRCRIENIWGSILLIKCAYCYNRLWQYSRLMKGKNPKKEKVPYWSPG